MNSRHQRTECLLKYRRVGIFKRHNANRSPGHQSGLVKILDHDFNLVKERLAGRNDEAA